MAGVADRVREQPAGDGAAPVAAAARPQALWSRLIYRFPDLPPAPRGRWARICLALVALMAVAYVAWYCAYLFAQHDAYLTHAEDLGIMDQALWNTLHGAPLHQTICNVISDSNCLGDVSRFAIHFEPIMLPLSLLYLIAPTPKALFFVQAAVVATGAFPTYWIASRRLRSPLAGVAFAAVYLLYPALTAAVTFDFHAVTLSAAFLMFALYFMLTRNNLGLFIACFLALTTKEEVPLDVLMIGLAVLALQRRPRVGLALIALSLAWIGLYALVVHVASPLGHSPVTSRYDYLGSGPVEIAVFILTHPLEVLRDHVFDPDGRSSLRSLLSGAGYLPLLSPFVLILAVPAVALNILSSNPTMRSGVYQYNAEIVPFLVLAAVESVALLAVLADAAWSWERVAPVRARLDAYAAPALAALRAAAARVAVTARASRDRLLSARPGGVAGGAAATAQAVWPRRFGTAGRVALVALTLLAFAFSFRETRGHGSLPLSNTFDWPDQTAHTRLADDLIKLIPPDASVSAQATLVPHISERRLIYQFPYRAEQSDYIFLDVTAFRYPYDGDTRDYAQRAQAILASGAFHIVAAEDGYLLLAHGNGPKLGPTDLPAPFYTFAELPPGASISQPFDARFGDALELVGYDVTPSDWPHVGTFFSVVTYWRVSNAVTAGIRPFIQENPPDAAPGYYNNFVSTAWLPMDTWQPGRIYAVQTDPILASGDNQGADQFSLSVLDASGHPLPAASAQQLHPAPNGGIYFATVQVG